MQTFLALAFNVVIAYSCGRLAARLGRNPNHWFVAGLFLGILAMLLLVYLSKKPVAAQTAPVPQPLPQLTPIHPAHDQKLWYFLDEQMTQFGPMSLQALSRAWNEGKIRAQTYVWNEEMEDWKTFQEVIKTG